MYFTVSSILARVSTWSWDLLLTVRWPEPKKLLQLYRWHKKIELAVYHRRSKSNQTPLTFWQNKDRKHFCIY